jgi:hypothetical protein
MKLKTELKCAAVWILSRSNIFFVFYPLRSRTRCPELLGEGPDGGHVSQKYADKKELAARKTNFPDCNSKCVIPHATHRIFSLDTFPGISRRDLPTSPSKISTHVCSVSVLGLACHSVWSSLQEMYSPSCQFAKCPWWTQTRQIFEYMQHVTSANSCLPSERHIFEYLKTG